MNKKTPTRIKYLSIGIDAGIPIKNSIDLRPWLGDNVARNNAQKYP